MPGEMAAALREVLARTGAVLPDASGRPTPRTPATPRPSEAERNAALAEAYRAVVEPDDLDGPPPAPAPPARRWLRVVAVVFLLAAGWMARQRTLAISAASAPLITTPEQRRQELRLLSLADKVAGHLERTGSLPASLSEAQVDFPDVSYEIRGGRQFALSVAVQSRRLRLNVDVPSSGPLIFAFVGHEP